MITSSPKNVIASIRQRLLNLSRERVESFDLTLNRYASERLLYRLSLSDHRDKFILKGAQLFAIWTTEMYRPTRDIDLLGYGEPTPEHMEAVFRTLCEMPVEHDDGLTFDADSIQAAEIREDNSYGGIRVRLSTWLGAALIPVQIDIGFGDILTPGPLETEFPVLLGHPAPQIRVYPIETVIAEKVQAMVNLGIANSRMKDFYDVAHIAGQFTFQGATLATAVQATFTKRGTVIPSGRPVALTAEFAEDKTKQRQWKAFLQRTGLDAYKDLTSLIEFLFTFTEPVLVAARQGDSLLKTWTPDKGWE